MCKCGNPKCTGFYLIHPKEVDRISEIKSRELEDNPNYKFELVESPSSGEIFTKFLELHVLYADMAE